MKRALIAALVAACAVALLGITVAGSATDDTFLKQVFTDAGNCPRWSCARDVFRDAGLAIPAPTTTSTTTTEPLTATPARSPW
jgi:hypothetical protein